MIDINTADGFTDESTPVGEAWAVVLNHPYSKQDDRKPLGGYVSEQLARIPLDDTPLPAPGIYRTPKRIR